MNTIFLGLVNRAVTAGWLVLAVLVLRLALRRAPRWVHCLLWAAVAVRLALPFSVESPASLIPTTQTVVPETVSAGHPVIQTGIPAVNAQITGYMGSRYYEGVTVPAGAAAQATETLSALWLIGAAILALYCLGTWLYMRSRLRTAVRLRDNLWQSEWVDSPFVLGLFRPRIYLPFHMDEETLRQVEAHERSHIARGDHVWKVLAFALLTLHWFHPLLWVAYFLFCRDLEYACDERVIRQLDGAGRKSYSDALLRCAAPRRSVAPCPVAFGETGVNGRIRNVLNYRKPAFWVALIAAVALIVTAVCFLTDPPVKDGRQWLRTRRAGNLGETSITVSYSQPGQRFHNTSLSHEQRKELSRLLRSVTDEQLTDADFDMEYPLGANLVFNGSVTLSRPIGISRPGVTLLYYKGNRTYINSPELADWLEGVLPGPPLMWHCIFRDGLPQSSLTIQPAIPFQDLEISYFSGSFEGGTPPMCVKGADGSISLTSGTVQVPSGGTAVWTPSAWDDDSSGSQNGGFDLSWHTPSAANRRASLDVSAVPAAADSGEPAIDYYITVFPDSSSLLCSLEGDVLTLFPDYPLIDNIPFNDFYGAERYDIDGDGVEEYCTLGMGITSGLFTFTFAAQAGGEVKYASIFNTRWYDLSFVRQNGVLKVKGVTQSGGESYFDISVRDGAVILSENGQELPYWGAPARGN